MNTNTRILKHQFEYAAPQTIDEAFELLGQHGAEAMLLAGGTDVIPGLKLDKFHPTVLIDISKLEELISISEEEGMAIGAAAKLRAVEQFCAGRNDYACLHDSIMSIGKIQVLNMGTLGGNLCTASPAADSVPSLLVLEAEVELRSLKGNRTLPLSDFISGPGQTAIDHGEIMSRIMVPPAAPGTGSAFIKMARVESDISKITCAVSVKREKEQVVDCKIALGAAAPTAVRIPQAEKLLAGSKVSAELLDDCGQAVAAGINPIDDQRSTAEYRTKIAAQLFKDTFGIAWGRAGGAK